MKNSSDSISTLNDEIRELINWAMIISSTSDSAATQKRFNHLLKEYKEANVERFNCEPRSDLEVVEIFLLYASGSEFKKSISEWNANGVWRYFIE